MQSICIIIPYYGSWPSWFELFMETCKSNPTINWLFISDNNDPKNICKNVKFIKLSFNNFINLLSEKLNLNIQINLKYMNKICEFRPAFGLIFSDYLKFYDFWGHSDIDVMYGNIRKFLNNDLLKKFEIISAHPGWLCGHFTIYKNSKKINNLFKLNPNFQVFLSSFDYYRFDEDGFTDTLNILKEKKCVNIFWDEQLGYEPPKNEEFSKNLTLYWNNGRTYGPDEREFIYYNNLNFSPYIKEYMYFHFDIWKKYYSNIIKFNYNKNHNNWNISKKGIIIENNY